MIRSFPVVSSLLLTGLLVSPAAAESVRLTWDLSSGAVGGYVVLQGTTRGLYTREVRVGATTNTADIGDLTAGTTYYFVVKAVDAAGVLTGPSNEIGVVAGAPLPPPPAPPQTPQPPSEPVPPPSSPPPLPPAPTPVGTPAGPALRPVPSLPAPTGTVRNVSSVGELLAAVAALQSETTIVLAPGTYRLPTTLQIRGSLVNVGIRGATTNADDVVLLGASVADGGPGLDGIRTSGFVRGFTLANLTLKDFSGLPISLENTHTAMLHNLHVYSDGRFLRALSPAGGAPSQNGVIQYSRFLYEGTTTDYRTGVDLQFTMGWRVRYNLFTNTTPNSAQRLGPAVNAWKGSNGTVVEANTFVNCSREIVLGMADTSPNQHTGGIIRNNMITRSAAMPGGGPAIGVLDSPGTRVLHNTVLLQGTSSLAIEYRYADTADAVIARNLTDAAVTAFDGATGVEDTNITTASYSWFVDPAVGDLRLLSTATTAIDAAPADPNVVDDHAGNARPYGAGSDIGANEATGFMYPGR